MLHALNLYVLVIILFPIFLFAESRDVLQSFKCKSKLQNIAKKWKSENVWKSEPRLNGELMHSTSTPDFGVWIQIYNESPDQINIEKTDSEAVLRFKVYTKNCKVDIETLARLKDSSADPVGTDKDLQKEINDKQN